MNDTPAAHAERVKARAAALGFELVGIATAEPFDADLQHTLNWIEQGLNAGMGWITPDRTRLACDPERLLPGARSIVVVGASYITPDAPSSDAVPRGRIARY